MAKLPVQESFIKLVLSQIAAYQKPGYKNSSKFESLTQSLFDLLPINTPLYLKEIEALLKEREKDKSLNDVSISKIKTKLKKSWYDYWVGQKNIAKNEEKYLNEYYPKLLVSQQTKLAQFAKNVTINPANIKTRPQTYYILKDIKNNDFKSLKSYLSSPEKISMKEGLSLIRQTLKQQKKKIIFTSPELLDIIISVMDKSSMPVNFLNKIWFNEEIISAMMVSTPEVFQKNIEILNKNNASHKLDSKRAQEMTINFLTSHELGLNGSTKNFINSLLIESTLSPLSQYDDYNEPSAISVATLQEFGNFWQNFRTIALYPNQKYKKLFQTNFNVVIDVKSDLLISLMPHFNFKAIEKEINYNFEDDLAALISPAVSSYPKIYAEQKALNLALPKTSKINSIKQKI